MSKRHHTYPGGGIDVLLRVPIRAGSGECRRYPQLPVSNDEEHSAPRLPGDLTRDQMLIEARKIAVRRGLDTECPENASRITAMFTLARAKLNRYHLDENGFEYTGRRCIIRKRCAR